MHKPTLHQFIVGASPGDAITDYALLLRRWLREDGFRSEIFAESIAPDLSGEVRTYLEYRPYPGELVILHHSIGTALTGELVILHHSIGTALVDDLLSLSVRFLIIYHNVTPPEFLYNIDPTLAGQLTRGRTQLARLRERTVLGLGASPYNETELQKMGFAPTGILPNILDASRYQLNPNPDLIARYRDQGPLLLFVGRLVPNKRQEDLIKLLACYRRIEPSARLLLVGIPWMPVYADWLQEIAHDLELGDAVILTGHVSQRDLVTYYRLADLYVSMSEHEGFGKPLIESMVMGLPVLAYAEAAVPGTMGESGVLFHEKDYEALAELVDILIKDDSLRKRIIARQRERARDFLEPQVHERWQTFLTSVADSITKNTST